jgi:4-hydroxy-2-oxovalerate aldolase
MQVTLLDCTLRDGSYAIDYQFTAEDTAVLASGLEQAGIRTIEIGHGQGLNASNTDHGVAAATDLEYLEAARKVLKKAKLGMFFIPGIGREEDLKMAAHHGMDFVRIGTNVTEVKEAARYIDIAKSLGLQVSANLMKTYVLPPADFLKQAKLAEKYGADILVVVDSSGGMLPQDVVNYVSILKNNTDLAIGYHGHNNLGLAISNTLEAIKSGATIVDATLRGMGRSAGNAQIEILVLLLEKLGYCTGIDFYKIMDIAEKLLKPLMRVEQQGIDSIGAISGYAQFHSSFLSKIYKVSQKHNIDPRELIVKVSEIDRVNVSNELAEAIAQELEKEKKEAVDTGVLWSADVNLQRQVNYKVIPAGESARNIAKELHSLSKKSGKYSVFTIAGSPNPHKKRSTFPFIRQNALCIIGNAEVTSTEEAVEIAAGVDGLVDVILVDAEERGGKHVGMTENVRKTVKKAKVLTYKDGDSAVNAAEAFICQLVPDLTSKKVTILGDTASGCKLALKLAGQGARVSIWGKNKRRLNIVIEALNIILAHDIGDEIYADTDPIEAVQGADILIGMIPYSPIISSNLVEVMSPRGMILDVGIRTICPDAIKLGIDRGIQMYRLDMRAGLSGEITTVLETLELTGKVIGSEDYNEFKLVAGGIIGRRGDIIVDSIYQPARIIGVADGQGGLLKENEKKKYQKKLVKAESMIIEKRLQWKNY